MKNIKLNYILIAIIVILVGAFGYSSYKFKKIQTKKLWQAVFLTNGQVYFGHLADINDQYIKLTDIYYLQIQKPLQPQPENQTQDQSKLSLIKLGSELHGPTDQMNINREQVLFYEELKSDSRVVQSIDKYQTEKK